MLQAADNKVTGKLGLITGASGGIGRAIARDLYRQGISLALTYLNNEDSIESLVTELDEYAASIGISDAEQPRISIHQADVASAEDLERVFGEIKEYHGQAGPDILVSTAGYEPEHQNITDIDISEFERTIDINLRSNFMLCKLAIPHMQAQHWGRIVFISSISSRGGGMHGAHYAASKAGLTGMMRNLAAKHAGDGITVNDVAPAMIGDTGMVPDEKFVEGKAAAMAPVGRLGTPQECAEVVGMFVRTGYMTGQSVLLSGGLK